MWRNLRASRRFAEHRGQSPADTLSTSVYRLRGAPGDEVRKIPCGIDVAVESEPAGAPVGAHVQRETLDRAAAGTGFRAGIPAVRLMEGHAGLNALVAQHGGETAKTRVRQRTGQAAVAHHAGRVQVFGNHCALVSPGTSNNRRARLVVGVASNVRDAGMDTGQVPQAPATSIGAGPAAVGIAGAGNRLLSAAQLAERPLVRLGVRYSGR